MLISKSQFVKYINKIKELREIEDAINSAGRGLESFSFSFSDYEDLIVKLLVDLFNDNENDWIGYYIYDLSFGSRWTEGMIVDDDEDVDLKTPEDLYDLLIKNLER
jgi:hypothetical protein